MKSRFPEERRNPKKIRFRIPIPSFGNHRTHHRYQSTLRNALLLLCAIIRAQPGNWQSYVVASRKVGSAARELN